MCHTPSMIEWGIAGLVYFAGTGMLVVAIGTFFLAWMGFRDGNELARRDRANRPPS